MYAKMAKVDWLTDDRVDQGDKRIQTHSGGEANHEK